MSPGSSGGPLYAKIIDHYDQNGFPEDLAGLLVVNTDPFGYMVYLNDEYREQIRFQLEKRRQRFH